MRAVSTISGTMLPLDRADVDTDQVIPQQFLKRIERTGYGDFLFWNWAHPDGGEPDPSFVLNRPEYGLAKVLITGRNFGCGSSREHAAWALRDWGFEAVVATSFADIFRANCAKNGLLTVELTEPEVEALLERAADPAARITIDLDAQTVTAEGLAAAFDIDPSTKYRLMHGLDDIDLTLHHEDAIARYEARRPRWRPKLEPGAA
jgi:3-isopropylmalate/(R)-2-methylmalate dehydratase small subunit